MNVDMIGSPQRRRGYLSAIEGTAATPEPSTRGGNPSGRGGSPGYSKFN
jgi:hypothetical protein